MRYSNEKVFLEKGDSSENKILDRNPKGGYSLLKNIIYQHAWLLLAAFILSFPLNIPLFSQDNDQTEDLWDMELADLFKLKITTAGKQAERIGDIPASVVVVSREDIEKYGYQTLGDILENIPGLYQTNDYFVQNFGVRGSWTDDPLRNIIVLVNDVPQTDGLTNSNFLQLLNIPIEAIDRIEVVRGPMSVIYGSGAFFGVINIKTNLVDGENPVSLASVAVGTNGTYRFFARASGKTDVFQYTFNAGYYKTAGLDVDMEKVGGPAFKGASTHKQLENAEKYFNFSGKFNNFYVNAGYTEADKEIFIGMPAVNDGFLTIPQSLRLVAGYDRRFSEKIRLDARFGYFLTRMWHVFDLVVPDLFGEQMNGSNGYFSDVTAFFDVNDKLNITAGVSYHNIFRILNEISAPLFGMPYHRTHLADHESVVTQSFYSQINYKISDKLKVVAGARIEQQPEFNLEQTIGYADPMSPLFGRFTKEKRPYSFTKIEFIPRISLLYSPNEKNVFKFLYGEAINRPSQFHNVHIFVNPSMIPLQPESIKTIEMNYIGQFSSDFSLSVSFFNNSLRKLIYRTLSVVGGAPVQYYSNVGKMTTNGAELTVNAVLAEDFNVELSATYQCTKDKRGGNIPEVPGYSPQFLGYLKTSYFFNENFSLAINGNYVGAMESYWDSTIGTAGRRLGQKVDSYFILGANLRIKNLFGTRLYINLKGDNLLDTTIYYPITSNNFNFATLGTIGRGLSFLFTLGCEF